MIQPWNELCAQMETSEGKLQEFINSAGLSALQVKKLQQFIKEWNQVKKLAEQFDQFITPLDPLTVELPFDQEDFRYMWKMWKDYLREQHGILMRSRMEKASIENLEEISGGDVDKAIAYIRRSMNGPYRRIYAIEYNDSKIPEKQPVEDGSNW